MKVFVSGGTGLIGKRLIQSLVHRGDHVVALSRNPSRIAHDLGGMVRVLKGDPTVPGNWQEAVNGMDAVIHLAGENIATKRWNPQFKKLIYSSRVDSTRNLVEAIRASNHMPSHFLAASAIGWYGDTGSNLVDESHPCGDDFLANLCRDWENASLPLVGTSVVRTVIRFGVVLDKVSGALQQLMRPVRWGIGGPIAGGRFFMSWIHLEDLKNLIIWLLVKRIGGTFNGVAPNPVTNAQFVKTLADQLGRFAIVPLPYCALRLGLGEIARFICSSQRVNPKATMATGFCFEFPTLDSALKNLIHNG